MADIFDFYVKDNRTIQFKFTEPIMLEDSRVTDWVFHIPRILNNIDVSGWAWWLVYINARGQKYSELLTLSKDPESPLEKCIATYSVDYSMSIRAGVVRFSLEAINADTQGTILNEWHTQTYQAKVQDTLQGNQVEFAETESDIISALIVEVQNKVAQLVGGATPEPVSLIADMTDTKKVYLYVGSETGQSTNYWYYYNGSAWVAGGLYASGITVDAVPTQGSSNAVSSGGVYTELTGLKEDLKQKTGLSEDAKIALLDCFEHVTWIDEHGQAYYDALYNALYPDTGLARLTAAFAQGSLVVYPTTPLSDLRPYLTVTGFYKDGTSGRITDYVLTGTLTTGTSTITAIKDGKTATFNVTVSQPYWDYEWDASSGTLPEGMTASAYDFTTEAGALYTENQRLDLDHVGNMRILIECKLYAFNTELQQESYRNFPQIVIANGNGKGCKLIASYNTNNPNGYVAFGVNNVNTLVDGVSGMEWHTYDINSVSGTHTLKVDNVTADIPQNTGTSQYITSTGIVSGYPEAPLVYVMCLKQFKYKIL